jgi:hypothetical protein
MQMHYTEIAAMKCTVQFSEKNRQQVTGNMQQLEYL